MNIIDFKKLDYALDFILKRIEQNMKTYSIIFPPPQSNNYINNVEHCQNLRWLLIYIKKYKEN